MLTNENCTLYLKDGNGFVRHYIPKCHWQESKASNVLKSGLQNADGVTVYIFAKDIGVDLKTALLARKSAAQDIIVRGECSFDFDNSSSQSASENLKALNIQADVHTVMSIDRLLYGSAELQHFKISAR